MQAHITAWRERERQRRGIRISYIAHHLHKKRHLNNWAVRDRTGWFDAWQLNLFSVEVKEETWRTLEIQQNSVSSWGKVLAVRQVICPRIEREKHYEQEREKIRDIIWSERQTQTREAEAQSKSRITEGKSLVSFLKSTHTNIYSPKAVSRSLGRFHNSTTSATRHWKSLYNKKKNSLTLVQKGHSEGQTAQIRYWAQLTEDALNLCCSLTSHLLRRDNSVLIESSVQARGSQRLVSRTHGEKQYRRHNWPDVFIYRIYCWKYHTQQ